MKKRLMVIFPIFGGVGHYVCHLKDSLKGYYDLSYASYKKDYITHKYFDRIEDELISKEIKNVHMLIETDKPQSAFELIGLIKKLKIDIVNIQLNPTAQLIFFFNFLITELHREGIPITLTVHDVLPHHRTRKDIDSVKLLYNRAVSHFFVGNRNERNKMMEIFNIPGSKITIAEHGVYNKFDKNLFDKETARKYLGIGKGKKMVLFFGNLKVYKGIDCLIKAMKSVVKEEPDSFCYISGSQRIEQLADKYKRMITSLKLERNVKLLCEWADFKKVEAMFRAADIVVLPYTRVSQSGVLLLAFYFKKPIIITDVFDEAGIFKTKRLGSVAKKGDAKSLAGRILDIFHNEQLAKEYSLNGYDYAMKYRGWNNIADKMHSVFQTLLKK